jgi:hypothetical protein
MSRKTGRRLLGPNLCGERASAGVPPINQFSNVFVVDEFATVGRGEALFYFLGKPFIVVDHTLDGFDHQRLAVAVLLGSEVTESCMKLRAQTDLHGGRVGAGNTSVSKVGGIL